MFDYQNREIEKYNENKRFLLSWEYANGRKESGYYSFSQMMMITNLPVEYLDQTFNSMELKLKGVTFKVTRMQD